MVCLFYLFSPLVDRFSFPVLGLNLDLTQSKCPANTSSPLWLAFDGVPDLYSTISVFLRKTGHHFHNFISWQDLRAAELVKSWNNSLIIKVTLFTQMVFCFVLFFYKCLLTLDVIVGPPTFNDLGH